VTSTFNKIGRKRGWGPMSRAQFEQLRAPRGAFLIGSPKEVIKKILAQHEVFRHQRFLMQIGAGTLGHAQRMRAIELFGTVVAPAVCAALGEAA
jgi:alkanesulfonate monooxygenase SsuD/methylene tetrahydromethanopterin reductase-like flavin-dependent oxidoreductase (luciferase family)